MVHLRVLSGRRAGAEFCGRHFPIRVGRASDAQLLLDDPGIWPHHFEIIWEGEGLVVQADPQALLEINRAPVKRAILRNGDTIMAGGASIRFSFTPLRQSSLSLREAFTWAALVGLCLAQCALIWFLPR